MGLIKPQKTIAFKVDEDFHMQVKLQSVKENKTLQAYVIEVLKKDLEIKNKKE